MKPITCIALVIFGLLPVESIHARGSGNKRSESEKPRMRDRGHHRHSIGKPKSQYFQFGRVVFGSNSVRGASVTLYKAGTEKGTGSVALGSATTDRNGHFKIRYAAPRDENAVIYLVADGPKNGVRLASVVGMTPTQKQCGPRGNLPSRFATINERTTVATAYTMAQFLIDGEIGGVAPGPKNSAATLRNLVNPVSGKIGYVLRSAPNGELTSTMPAFNSLGNMLAACANGPVECRELFALATPPGGDPPEDTLHAVLNIARYSWHNALELFEFSRRSSLYAPALDAAPVTWTLALKYTGTGTEFDGPGAMAIDADGNVWANNNYVFRRDHSLPSCGSNVLSKLTPDGRDFPGAPYTGGGLNGAGFGITLDPSGNVWVGNFGFFGSTCQHLPPANSVSVFTSEGVAISPESSPTCPGGGFCEGNLDGPQATVSDQKGNIWIANACGGSVTMLYADPEDGFWNYDIRTDFGETTSKPFGIAIDTDGNGWITENQNDRVIQLTPEGELMAFSFEGSGINAPMGIAIDSLGFVWVSNSGIVNVPCSGNAGDDDQNYGDLSPDLDAASVTQLNANGSSASADPYKGAGMLIPWGIAVDGDDNIWVANFAGSRVSQIRGANTATWPYSDWATGDPIAPQGFHSDALVRNTGISIDPSGNVWLANNWLQDPVQTNPGGDGLVVFIGIAAPIKTPFIGPPSQD